MQFESLTNKNNSESLSLKYAYGRALAAHAKTYKSYPSRSLSVIIPSRLQKNPLGKFWLEDTVQSIMNQSVYENLDIEIIVGVDSDSDLESLPDWTHFKIVKSRGKSQAEALNAAAEVATGEIIAFIEDDDLWHPRKLHDGLIALNCFDFVSSNQLEFIVDSNGLKLFQGINEYATPSGWMMRRELFNKIGFFDPSFRYHLDSEWLGRLNQSGAKRCHMVEHGCQTHHVELLMHYRNRLAMLFHQSPTGSCIWNTNHDTPLVFRATHPGSGMSQIASDSVINKISLEEHRLIHEKYKNNPH